MLKSSFFESKSFDAASNVTLSSFYFFTLNSKSSFKTTTLSLDCDFYIKIKNFIFDFRNNLSYKSLLILS